MPVADFAQGVTSSDYWASHMNSLKPQPKAAATADASTDKPLITTSADGKSFFENMLDIVNPLEHLPIVSTIYHAITGNQSGDLEKMAGDTLYGGPMGLASSVADIAFEKITGKSFGDTVMSWVGLDNDDASSGNTALASKTATTPDAATAALNKGSLAPAANMAQAATALPLVANIMPFTAVANSAPAQLATPDKLTSVSTDTAAAPANAQSAVDISPQTDALLQSLQRNGITGPMQAQALDAYRRSMTLKPAYVN